MMKEKLLTMLEYIQREADKPVQGRVYVDTGPILERDFAERAGLGWYGKHTNLIHKRLGSWLLLGEVLVDLALDYDRPATAHCGTCTRCIEACPTEAIVFGDINDKKSRVAKLKASPLNYGILMELNTRPRTTYLASVKNPNSEIVES